MLAIIRRRWTDLDNTAKRATFIAASVNAIAFAAGITVGLAVSPRAGVGAAFSIVGMAVTVLLLMGLTVQLFPDPKD